MQIEVSVMLKSIDVCKNVYISLTQSTATYIISSGIVKPTDNDFVLLIMTLSFTDNDFFVY